MKLTAHWPNDLEMPKVVHNVQFTMTNVQSVLLIGQSVVEFIEVFRSMTNCRICRRIVMEHWPNANEKRCNTNVAWLISFNVLGHRRLCKEQSSKTYSNASNLVLINCWGSQSSPLLFRYVPQYYMNLCPLHKCAHLCLLLKAIFGMSSRVVYLHSTAILQQCVGLFYEFMLVPCIHPVMNGLLVVNHSR